MPQIGFSAQFTLNLGNYQSGKYEMSVSGIDTSSPLEPQLAVSQEYLQRTTQWLEEQLFTHLKDNQLIDAVREYKR